MGKTFSPSWTLNEQWAVGLNDHNWALYRRSGNRWRPVSYFASPEQLLQALYRKITLTQPADDSLIAYVERCFDAAQAAADLFAEHVAGLALPAKETSVPAAHSSSEASNSASFSGEEVSHAP